MKATISRKALTAALATVSAASARNGAQLAVLLGVRIDIGDDTASVCCTDLDLTITSKLAEVNVAEAGTAIPPARIFAAYLGAVDGDLVHLDYDNPDLTVTCGESSATFRCYPNDDWPRSLLVEGAPTAWTRADFDAVRHVMHAANGDPNRPMTVSIHLEGDRVEATDSYRLARSTLTSTDMPAMSIPARTMAAVLRNIGDEATVTSTATAVRFDDGTTVWQSALNAIDWPKTDQLVRADTTNTLTFDCEAMRKACDRMRVFAGKTNPLITIKRDGDKIHLQTSLIDVGAVDDTLTVEGSYDGNITFNAGYLAEALEVHGPGQVTVDVVDAMKPGQIRRDGLLLLLMPVRKS